MIKSGTPSGMVLSWFRKGLDTNEIGARLGIKEHIIARTLRHERDAEYHAAIASKSKQPLEGDKAGQDVQIAGIHRMEDGCPVGSEGPDRGKKDQGQI